MVTKKKTEQDRFAPFTTHTGLLIHVDAEDEQFVVRITGTAIKDLLRTPDEAAAIKYANGLKEHYEERAKAEA